MASAKPQPRARADPADRSVLACLGKKPRTKRFERGKESCKPQASKPLHEMDTCFHWI